MEGMRATDVVFRHGSGPEVLAGVTLEARPGEILGLLGVNGAGKTTLFRLLAGLYRPNAGALEIAGVDVRADPRQASRLLGYVPDEPLLYPALSALENLSLFSLLWGVPAAAARPRAEALLREAGLWEERNVLARAYSRGMRQKLSVCCALLHAPKVLLLDEPFNALDLSAVLWLREKLRSLVAEGACVILSSHQPEAIDAQADRLAVLHQGRIAALFTRAELQGQGGTAQVFGRICGLAHGRGTGPSVAAEPVIA